MAAGILYIVGTVTGILSTVASGPLRSAADPLSAAAEHPGQVVTAALLVLVMGLSLGLVPVVLFPVLRSADEVLAVGYLVVRGGVETVCYCLLALAWLLLAPLSGIVSTDPGTASSTRAGLGALVLGAGATTDVLALVFCVGAALFYAVLYRSRIAPRWIAAWGLAAVPVYVAAHLLAMYSVIGADSSVQVVMVMPLAVQEMVLAVWMLTRGFWPAMETAPADLDEHGAPSGIRTWSRADRPDPLAQG